jgi:hypothetical protein
LVLGVVVGDDMTRVELARRTDDPVVIGEDADVTQAGGGVDERELRDAHRVVAIDQHIELVVYAFVRAGEPRDAGFMPDQHPAARRRPRQRPRSW